MSTKNRNLMLLENAPYPWDQRVRREATALTITGLYLTILCPKYLFQPTFEVNENLRIQSYHSSQGVIDTVANDERDFARVDNPGSAVFSIVL